MEFFEEKKAMSRLDEGGGLWYSNSEKSITDKRSAQKIVRKTSLGTVTLQSGGSCSLR